MKLVIQRVTCAAVESDGVETGRIGKGLVLLLGIELGDTLEQANQLAIKVAKLRLWPDLKERSKQWVSSVVDNSYQLLVISQFTLFATFKKPKPDFHQAMGGDEAKLLYEAFVEQARKEVGADNVQTGVFGSMMQVDLRNDGPVTVELVAVPSAAAGSKAKVNPTATAPVTAVPDSAPKLPSCEDPEARLMLQPYMAGFDPSQADVELFERLSTPGVPPPKTPNLARWYHHVASFSVSERAQWAQ